MGREGVRDKVGGGVTNMKVLAFGGIEVLLPLFGPIGAGALENFMAVMGAMSLTSSA